MSRKFVNYYEILGVSQNASENQIRKAYGEKLREYRQLKKNKSNIEFERLARAYRVLMDENNRELYDRKLEDYLYEKALKEEEIEVDNTGILQKYKAIRGKEKQMFIERHGSAEDYLNEKYENSTDTIVKIKKGVIHIFGEAFYKLDSLRYLEHDNFKKYVIRNRQVLGAVLVVGALAIGAPTIKKANEKDPVIITAYAEDKTAAEYTFNKIYVVQKGDNFWDIMQETGFTESELKNANNSLFDNTIVHPGDEIKLPYKISTNKLEEYVEIVDKGDIKSARELAKIYETDLDTIVELNKSNLEYNNDTHDYEIITDQVIVPSFDEIVKKYK